MRDYAPLGSGCLPGDWTLKTLVAIPVYNEGGSVAQVVRDLQQTPGLPPLDILAINDGSSDDTAVRLAQIDGIMVLTHPKNLGYGAALISAFQFAIEKGYDSVISMDADGQHEPRFVTDLAKALEDCDIASGSRYLKDHDSDTAAPGDRRRVNQVVTRELNEKLGLHLTDSFCGFKGYRVCALKKLNITETGYGMPLQLWVQAAKLGLLIQEIPVPRIYLDPNRSFGVALDQAEKRLVYYREIMEREINQFKPLTPRFPQDLCAQIALCCGL